VVGAVLASGVGACSYVDEDGLPRDADMEAHPVLRVRLAGAEAGEVDVAVRDRPDPNKVARRLWTSEELTGTAVFTAALEETVEAGARYLAMTCDDDLLTLTGTAPLGEGSPEDGSADDGSTDDGPTDDGPLALVDVIAFTTGRPAELSVRLTAGASTEHLREPSDSVVEGDCPPDLVTTFEDVTAD
jgi:hypothetical protein